MTKNCPDHQTDSSFSLPEHFAQLLSLSLTAPAAWRLRISSIAA